MARVWQSSFLFCIRGWVRALAQREGWWRLSGERGCTRDESRLGGVRFQSSDRKRTGLLWDVLCACRHVHGVIFVYVLEVFTAVFDNHFMEHYWTYKCTTYIECPGPLGRSGGIGRFTRRRTHDCPKARPHTRNASSAHCATTWVWMLNTVVLDGDLQRSPFTQCQFKEMMQPLPESSYRPSLWLRQQLGRARTGRSANSQRWYNPCLNLAAGLHLYGPAVVRNQRVAPARPEGSACREHGRSCACHSVRLSHSSRTPCAHGVHARRTVYGVRCTAQYAVHMTAAWRCVNGGRWSARAPPPHLVSCQASTRESARLSVPSRPACRVAVATLQM